MEPQINAEGVHVWPFDPSFPIEVRFLIERAAAQHVRMNRHDYFEVIYLCAGKAELQIQNRSLTLRRRGTGRYRQHAVSQRRLPLRAAL